MQRARCEDVRSDYFETALVLTLMSRSSTTTRMVRRVYSMFGNTPANWVRWGMTTAEQEVPVTFAPNARKRRCVVEIDSSECKLACYATLPRLRALRSEIVARTNWGRKVEPDWSTSKALPRLPTLPKTNGAGAMAVPRQSANLCGYLYDSAPDGCRRGGLRRTADRLHPRWRTVFV